MKQLVLEGLLVRLDGAEYQEGQIEQRIQLEEAEARARIEAEERSRKGGKETKGQEDSKRD